MPSKKLPPIMPKVTAEEARALFSPSQVKRKRSKALEALLSGSPDLGKAPGKGVKRGANSKSNLLAREIIKAISFIRGFPSPAFQDSDKGSRSLAFRNNVTGIYNKEKGFFRKNVAARVGVSDILGSLAPDGRFLAVEIKIGKDTLSEAQRGFLEDVNKSGGVGITASSYEDFYRKMINHKNTPEWIKDQLPK